MHFVHFETCLPGVNGDDVHGQDGVGSCFLSSRFGGIVVRSRVISTCEVMDCCQPMGIGEGSSLMTTVTPHRAR